jgi:hypothetical protein
MSAQGYKDFTSARHFALGGATSSLAGNQISLDNQGSLSKVEDKEICLSYRNEFFLSELSTFGIGAILPTKAGVFGANISRFGNLNYSQNTIGIAYGKNIFEKFNFGMRLNLNRLQQNEYGNVTYPTVELGFLSPLSENLTIAGHVYNPFRSKLITQNETYFRVASALRLGMNYSIDKVSILVDLESNTTQNLLLKSGIEYHASDVLDLRFGLNFPNQLLSAGVGFNTESLIIDFYYQTHLLLGGSAGTTLTYVF